MSKKQQEAMIDILVNLEHEIKELRERAENLEKIKEKVRKLDFDVLIRLIEADVRGTSVDDIVLRELQQLIAKSEETP